MSPRPLLAGRNLSVRFGDVVAVADASVEVQPGEAVGVVGESGSGKTTLARVLAGLLRPAQGEVLLDGEPVFGAHSRAEYPHSERWKVQMVFQDPYSSLNPRQRAWQAVAEAVQVWRHVARVARPGSRRSRCCAPWVSARTRPRNSPVLSRAASGSG